MIYFDLQRFYASLSDIKSEVETVLREGRQLVEDGCVEDQVTVSAQLDAMKALYNRVREKLDPVVDVVYDVRYDYWRGLLRIALQLGEQVAIARETLERALQLSDDLNRDLNALNDWLNHLEAEIHKREGEFTENPNTKDEIAFYEVICRPFPPTYSNGLSQIKVKLWLNETKSPIINVIIW